MLFDLRGRGRRRTVQVIYLGLAVLMGGGLVLLGIGGNTSGGGLLDAFTNGNSSSLDSGFAGKQREAAERRVKADRRDDAAWAALARARYQEATQVGVTDPETGAFDENGRVQLRKADAAWKQYLELEPPKPDATVAVLMTQVYGPTGLGKPAEAVAAQEIVATERDDLGSYLLLAGFAFSADQTRKGDLAGEKAIALATKEQKEQVKAQVESLKSQAQQQAAQAAQGAAPPAVTTAK